MKKIITVYQERPEELNYSNCLEIIQESQANLNKKNKKSNTTNSSSKNSIRI